MTSSFILLVLLGAGFLIFTIYKIILPSSNNAKNIKDYEFESKLQKESAYSYHIGDIDKTINITKKALNHNPKDHVSRFILGKLHLEKKDFYNAIDQFEQIKKLNPKHIPTREKLAESYIGIKNHVKAEEELNFILQIKPNDTKVLHTLAYIYEKNKDLPSCINIFKRMINKDPKNKLLREKFAHLCNLNGEFSRAIKEYEQLLEENEDIEYIKSLAELYTKTQQCDKAINMLEEIIATDEADSNTAKRLAYLYKDMGKLDKALDAFQKLSPLTQEEELQIQESIAQIYLSKGEPDNTVEVCAKMLEISPEYDNAKILISKSFEFKKEFEPAIDVIREMIIETTNETKEAKLNDYLSSVLSNWAIDCFEQSKYQEAFDKFLAALQYNDKNPDIYLNLAKTNHKIRNYEEAISHYKRALQLSPENAEIYIGLGELYKEMENTKQAITQFEKAIEIDKNNTTAYSALGKVYADQKMYDNAINFFKKVVEIDPYSTEDRFYLAHSYQKTDENYKAIKEYEKLLSQKPDHDQAVKKLKELTETK